MSLLTYRSIQFRTGVYSTFAVAILAISILIFRVVDNGGDKDRKIDRSQSQGTSRPEPVNSVTMVPEGDPSEIELLSFPGITDDLQRCDHIKAAIYRRTSEANDGEFLQICKEVSRLPFFDFSYVIGAVAETAAERGVTHVNSVLEMLTSDDRRYKLFAKVVARALSEGKSQNQTLEILKDFNAHPALLYELGSTLGENMSDSIVLESEIAHLNTMLDKLELPGSSDSAFVDGVIGGLASKRPGYALEFLAAIESPSPTSVKAFSDVLSTMLEVDSENSFNKFEEYLNSSSKISTEYMEKYVFALSGRDSRKTAFSLNEASMDERTKSHLIRYFLERGNLKEVDEQLVRSLLSKVSNPMVRSQLELQIQKDLSGFNSTADR